MKTLQLFSALVMLTGSCFADAGKVTITSSPQSGNSSHDNKTHDESRQHWVELKIRNLSQVRLEGLKLKWTLFASDLQCGTDRLVTEKSGEQAFSVDGGGEVMLATPKVTFHWTPMHYERTGTGRRARSKKVDETGHRYHGYRVEVLLDGVVIGEAASQSSLLKAIP